MKKIQLMIFVLAFALIVGCEKEAVQDGLPGLYDFEEAVDAVEPQKVPPKVSPEASPETPTETPEPEPTEEFPAETKQKIAAVEQDPDFEEGFHERVIEGLFEETQAEEIEWELATGSRIIVRRGEPS